MVKVLFLFSLTKHEVEIEFYVWDPSKIKKKQKKISFYGWILCIIKLYLTTILNTKTKTNTLNNPPLL
jgi:hypothetical protein